MNFTSLRMRLAPLILFCVWAWAQGVYEANIGKAFSRARAERKPLWIMVSATWCGVCRRVEQVVLPDSRFQEALQRDFLPVKVYASSGAESTPGADSLAELYRVRIYPTFLCMEPTGQVFFRQEGVYSEALRGEVDTAVRVFLEQIEEAKRARKEMPTLHRRFQRGERSIEFLRKYLRELVKLSQKSDIPLVFEAYLKAAGSVRRAWLGEPGYYLLLHRLAELGPSYATYAIQIADTLRSELDSSQYEKLYYPILLADFRYQTAGGLSWSEKVEKAEKYAKTLADRFPFVERLLVARLWREGITASDEDTRERAAVLAMRSVALNWPLEIPDPALRERWAASLQEVSWAFYERIDTPEKLWVAVIWMKYALSIQPEEWLNWYTLGALYTKLGRKKEALGALEKAIELAQKQELPKEEYEEAIELKQKAASLSD